MGKWCLHASSFIFYWIIIKVAGNQYRHKSLVKLILGRIRPLILELLALEWRKFHTFELEFSEASWPIYQILCVASLGGEKAAYGFGADWIKTLISRKPPLTYNGENDVSTFSWLFLIQSFLYLQVTRSCIKSRTSLNFSLIGPLTTELAALEV